MLNLPVNCALTTSTKAQPVESLTCLLGNPVKHSFSPSIFEEMGRLTGITHRHVRFDVEASGNLLAVVSCLKDLGFKGCNITLPYKINALELCDEVDPLAKRAGCVNTMVFKADGSIAGYNTDVVGVRDSFAENLGSVNPGDNVLVIGAGGAARAALTYLEYVHAVSVTVINRSPARLTSLKDQFPKIHTLTFDQWKTSKSCGSRYNVVINATSIGMTDKYEDHALADTLLQSTDLNGARMLDAVFTFTKPALARAAEIKGAKVANGAHWMIHQAFAAFRLWNNKEPRLVNDIATQLMRLVPNQQGQ